MSDTQPSKPRRNYACLGDYYEPQGPPIAVVSEDQHGPLIRTSPFGARGLFMCITIERWRQWNTIVEKAISDAAATRLSTVSL